MQNMVLCPNPDYKTGKQVNDNQGGKHQFLGRLALRTWLEAQSFPKQSLDFIFNCLIGSLIIPKIGENKINEGFFHSEPSTLLNSHFHLLKQIFIEHPVCARPYANEAKISW